MLPYVGSVPAYPDDRSAEITAALEGLPAGSPVSEVARRLMDLFTGGSIEPGTRLPPERQLAATLGVGRSAVREALAALEILGIVDVRAGSGTYLRGTASDLLPQTLRWGLLIGRRSTSDLLDVRSGLEIYAARLAARRADARHVARMATSLDRMRSAATELATFARPASHSPSLPGAPPPRPGSRSSPTSTARGPTSRIGVAARSIVSAATLPRTSRSSPVRPWVASAIRST